MSPTRFAPAISLAVLLLCAACGGPVESPAFEQEAQGLTTDNGRTLNGRTLNGRTLNGTSFSAVQTHSSLAGIVMADGLPLDSAQVQGTVFTGTRGGTTTFQGTQFLNARFTTTLSNGGSVTARIDGMIPLTGTNADLFEYQVSWYDPGNQVWRPLCTDAWGNAMTAIPLANRWNYQQGVPDGGAVIQDTSVFTFACKTGALAKCALAGYRPWVTTSGGKSLAQYHQACVRMLRADYCGNGTSYTQDNTPVNLYDNLGIQSDDRSWSFEAQWDERGARCMNLKSRSSGLLLGCGLPACLGGPFSAGGVLASEIYTSLLGLGDGDD